MLKEYMAMAVAAILTENFVMVKFLGICPFLGVSKKTATAAGMGMAVTFVMALSSAMTWWVNRYLLVPPGLEYLQTIAFILIIACLVQFVEMFLKKVSPALYSALGIYLPLITTNCAVLGAAILEIQKEYDLVQSVLYGTFSAVGFMAAIVLLAGVRERLELCKIPKCLEGFPITLIAAGLIAMAFMGFAGIKV